MSLWGQTQTVSLFLILVAVWAAQADRPALAWIFIMLAALSRPQLVVPGFVLGLLLLRWVRPGRSIQAVAWATLVIVLVTGPFMLTAGPSFPLSYLLNI